MEEEELHGPDHVPPKLLGNLWARPILVSVTLVIPCFWQPIVSGADLQSHLYNAWLAELIRRGSVHGLWIGHQSTNILVDMLLSWLIRYFGVSVAERVITTALLLVFFWGSFHFISAVRGRAVYWLAPWLAMLSYGHTFQLGLLNYYLSCGIVLWLLGVVWRQPVGRRWLWAAPLLILAYLAHPLPVLWFLGIAAYCRLARRMQFRRQVLLFLVGVAVLFSIRSYAVARYITSWRNTQLMAWTGFDQLWLYGWSYLLASLGFLVFSIVLLSEPENRWRAIVSVPGQVYFLTAIAVAALPSGIRLSLDNPNDNVTFRLSLFSGILLLAILSRSTYRRWYVPAGLLTASIFFGALFGDIRREARVEARMENLAGTLPAGQRVISFIDLYGEEKRDDPSAREREFAHLARRFLSLNGGRLEITHLVSRACVGHCFDYLNYEPATGQFRIRAAPGNPVVVATYRELRAMESDTYAVKASDLPLHALIRCGPRPGDIFMRPMAKGETGAMLACPGAPAPR